MLTEEKLHDLLYGAESERFLALIWSVSNTLLPYAHLLGHYKYEVRRVCGITHKNKLRKFLMRNKEYVETLCTVNLERSYKKSS